MPRYRPVRIVRETFETPSLGYQRVRAAVNKLHGEKDGDMKALIGNKASEKDIRDWLSQNGFNGKTAQFKEIELHAIQRPGWLQIFRFEFVAFSTEDHKVNLYGAMHSDERLGPPLIVSAEIRTTLFHR